MRRVTNEIICHLQGVTGSVYLISFMFLKEKTSSLRSKKCNTGSATSDHVRHYLHVSLHSKLDINGTSSPRVMSSITCCNLLLRFFSIGAVGGV